VHTEVIGKLGWFDRVFVSPSNHRVHHGQNDYCIDKNYGGVLIIWDRIFGTFTEERDDEKVVYGVRKAVHSFNPLWVNLHHYAALAREAAQTQGWRRKLHVWLAPPGGWHHERVEPFDAAAFVAFNPQPPADVKRYAMVHYGAAVMMLAHFLMVQPSLGLPERIAYAGIIIAGLVTNGALLEGACWAFRAEAVRLAGVIAGIVAFPVWFTLATPFAARAAMIVALVYCLGWALRGTRQASSQGQAQAQAQARAQATAAAPAE
jgi:hypothetical protein